MEGFGVVSMALETGARGTVRRSGSRSSLDGGREGTGSLGGEFGADARRRAAISFLDLGIALCSEALSRGAGMSFGFVVCETEVMERKGTAKLVRGGWNRGRLMPLEAVLRDIEEHEAPIEPDISIGDNSRK